MRFFVFISDNNVLVNTVNEFDNHTIKLDGQYNLLGMDYEEVMHCYKSYIYDND